MGASSATISPGVVFENDKPGVHVPKQKKVNDADDKKAGRPKSDKVKGDAISTRLDEDWQAAWEEFIESCDPPTTEAAALRAAIKMYLTSKGYAPRKP